MLLRWVQLAYKKERIFAEKITSVLPRLGIAVGPYLIVPHSFQPVIRLESNGKTAKRAVRRESEAKMRRCDGLIDVILRSGSPSVNQYAWGNFNQATSTGALSEILARQSAKDLINRAPEVSTGPVV